MEQEKINTITLEMPYPPSVNHLYIRGRNNTFLSPKGTAFYLSIKEKIMCEFGHVKPIFTGHTQVEIEVFPPDKKKRDLDNLLKCTLDALQYANVITDDFNIQCIVIKRQSPIKGGKLLVTITDSA